MIIQLYVVKNKFLSVLHLVLFINQTEKKQLHEFVNVYHGGS